MKENQPQTLPVYPVQYISNTQDEISLVEIWLTLRKHRKLFLITAIGVTLLGLVLALLTTKGYDLNTSLEIGTEIRDGIPTPIESPETTKAKLESALIPMVKNELNSDKEEPKRYKVDVAIPKNSALIVLTSKTSKKDESMYRDLHNKIVGAISQDHSKFIKLLKNNLQAELALANIHLDEMKDPTTLDAVIRPQEKILADANADLSALNDPEIFGAEIKVREGEVQTRKDQLVLLEDQAVVLEQKLKKITINQELIRNQIKELEVEVERHNTVTEKKRSAQGMETDIPVMAQLMFDNEAQQNRKLLAELKERLFITLENEKITTQMSLEAKKRAQNLQMDKITEAEASLKAFTGKNLLAQNKLKASVTKTEANIAHLLSAQKRKIATQQQVVGEIQIRLDNLMETRAVIEPTLSSQPTSTPKRLILLIVMFLGGILGIVVVFFAELREKVAETVEGTRS